MRLGEFELGPRIGAGATGEVFSGTHLATGAPVAVKVVHTFGAVTGFELALVEHEAAAMARLGHRGIVEIIDYGRVDEGDAAASGQLLPAGSPYLVMERAFEGSLARRPPVTSFEELYELLSQILQALAHAHARGLVHRDLKPSNVLVFGQHPLRVKLADFGIARILDAEGEPAGPVESGGTPLYMAPEQIAQITREQGPCTDVYALGCLAYTISTGEAPHLGTAAQVCRAHLLDRPPPLECAFALPEGFRPWLQGCMAKQPGLRFSDAAGALRALDAYASPLAQDREAPHCRVTVERALARPTEPPDWRHLEPASAPRKLRAAGLSLLSIRQPPCMGREAEKDLLWHGLGEVLRLGTPRLVFVHGSPGIGKSRLLHWLVELAGEHALAHTSRANHGSTPGAGMGLVHALRRLIAGGDDPGAPARAAARLSLLAASLPEDDTLDFGALFEGPWEHVDAGVMSPLRPEERYATWGRLLSRLARTRPVILALDDVEFGAESLRLVQHLSRSVKASNLPLLIVAAFDDAALAGRPDESALVATLAERAQHVHLEALPDVSCRALLARHLGLEDSLARRLASQSAGNPLFAHQLVAALGESGRLSPSPSGFVLAGEGQIEFPESAIERWRERLGWLWSAYPEEERVRVRRTAELAGLLGDEFRDADWRAALAELGLGPPGDVATGMLSRGLVRARPEGWAFAHRLLRDVLVESAESAGRAPEAHAAIAAALSALPDADSVPERIAHHREAAGQTELASVALYAAANEHFRACRFEPGHAALDRRDRLLEELGEAAHGPMRARGTVLAAEALGMLGMLEPAMRRLSTLDGADAGSYAPTLRCDLMRVRGMVTQMRGGTREGHAYFQEALALASASNDPHRLARCHHGVAECAKLDGRLADAESGYRAAIANFAAAGDLAWRARSTLGLGDCVRRRGALAEAEALIHEGMDLAMAAGSSHAVVVARNTLGDTARRAGRLRDAAHHYRDAVRELHAMQSPDADLVRVNLGLVEFERGRLERAREVFRVAAQALRQSGRAGYAVFADAGLVACAAECGDWDELEELLAELESALAAGGLVDEDLARPLVRATRAARAADRSELAARLAGLARHQLEVLGLPLAPELWPPD